MLDWPRSDNEQEDQGGQAFIDSLEKFRQHVSKTYQKVESFSKDLKVAYPEEALITFSAFFEGISKEYSEFTIITSNPFYDVIRRSKSRLDDAKKVAQKAKSLAQLFEKYTKRPNSYSAVNARLEINKLTAELTNLVKSSEYHK